MLKRILYTLGVLVSLLTAASGFAQLQLPGNPVLRDPSICLGPGGTYYLTGTTVLPEPNGEPELCDNRGVQVWRSADLKSWQDLGYVWDMWEDVELGHGAWQGELMPLPGLPPGDRVRAMTAPELHYFNKRFWIVHSMNGYAVGLMGSKGEKIDGDYVNYRIMKEAGASATGQSDGSLFVDTDGTPHLLWGGGCLARLRSDLDTLVKKGSKDENQVGIEGVVHYLSAAIDGFPLDDGLPEHGPFYGAFLFHDGARYNLILTAATFRNDSIHQDAFIASAEKLTGPYTKLKLLAPDAGQVTVFQGPGDIPHAVYASMHPASDRFRQPTIVPMKTDGPSWALDAPIDPASKKPIPLPQTPGPARASVLPEPMNRPAIPDDVQVLLETVQPLFDHPLRHTAICRADDRWYLTGTEGTRRDDGLIDWSRNRGVRLWKSTDKKNWEDLGYVWEIEKQGKTWHQQEHMDLTVGAWPKIGRAVTAPELHNIRNQWFISYSMNGQGTGLLKSRTGQPEGPYEHVARMTRHGRDASMLADGDDVYWVWGEGFCAKMNDALTALEYPVKMLFTRTAWYPRYMRRPELMGQWGSHLVRAGEWYIWTFATRTGRFGNNTIDVFASWSKSLDGPWGEPCLALSNSGQTTITPDGHGGFMASVSGEDEYSACPFRPAMSPIGSGTGNKDTHIREGRYAFSSSFKLRPYGEKSVTTAFSAVETRDQTSLDLWAGYPDYLGCSIRDVYMTAAPDGFYYLTGSLMDEPFRGTVNLFRSKDKLRWERLPPVYRLTATTKSEEWDQQAFDQRFNKRGGNKTLNDVPAMEMKCHFLNGHWYMSGNVGNRALIKSTTDHITGPYEYLRTVPGCCDLTQDVDGYVLHNVVTKTWRMKDIERDSFSEIKPYVASFENHIHYTEDCEAGVLKVDGKYLLYSTDWTGSYDQTFIVADSLEGPWSRPRIGAPYGGNGYIFKDYDGSWWFACFQNNNEYGKRAGMWCRTLIYPLFIGWESGKLIIEPEAVRENRARLERMGALWQRPRPTDNTECHEY